MKFNMKSLFVLAISSMATIVSAAPTENVVARFSAVILSPNSASVWPANTVQTVTWDPAGEPDTDSLLLLVKGGTLFGNHRLAANFSITAGSVDVTVPDVVAGDDYQLAFFGTGQGVVSQEFTVTV
ncbi:hypothetical protein BDQ12DRAFT_685317 [Crucibulum laeve]|uniref:Yeast cell wall synthesis Kre9/Knh1-like N-terminal domain-containing protein n=1 Tax=Crucibulum laeve TaxID=68775 RepID=A0A5C3LX78_9AGAR|nr:hypothetical protein BDQ12DRAFT_685317 [Crucibulum laeve]